MKTFKALSVKDNFALFNGIGVLVGVIEVREKAVKIYHNIGSGWIKTAWIPKSCLEFDTAYNEHLQINCDDCETIDQAIEKNFTTDDWKTMSNYHRALASMYR